MWLVLCVAGLTILGSIASSAVVIWICKGVLEAQRPVLLRQLDLLDKTTALAAARDLAAYQGIQVMDQQAVGYDGDYYDPSDAAAARREAEQNGWDPEELTDGDQEALRAAFE